MCTYIIECKGCVSEVALKISEGPLPFITWSLRHPQRGLRRGGLHRWHAVEWEQGVKLSWANRGRQQRCVSLRSVCQAFIPLPSLYIFGLPYLLNLIILLPAFAVWHFYPPLFFSTLYEYMMLVWSSLSEPFCNASAYFYLFYRIEATTASSDRPPHHTPPSDWSQMGFQRRRNQRKNSQCAREMFVKRPLHRHTRTHTHTLQSFSLCKQTTC